MIAGVLSVIVGGIFMQDSMNSDIITVIYTPALVAMYLPRGGIFVSSHPSSFEVLTTVTLNGAVYGMIIGWFYDKMKNRKQLSTNQ